MNKIFFSFALLSLALLGLVSCQPDREVTSISFDASIEQPTTYDEDGKHYLRDEHYIFWEHQDSITVIEDGKSGLKDTVHAHCVMHDVRESGFHSETEADINLNKAWVGYYPASAYDPSASRTLYYSNEIIYRTDALGDYTFGKEAFPMVAYRQANAARTLGFHSVSGILRFQLYSVMSSQKTIDYIEFESFAYGSIPQQQISGKFAVQDIDKYSPYLKPSSNAAPNNKITIKNIGKKVGAGSDGAGGSQLCTFYLPLPAQSDGSGQNLTQYALRMTVHTTDGYTFQKNLTADIRRNAINKMQAIEITGWSTGGPGSGNVQMVGCGTKERPFQIYTYSDLVKARDAMNSVNPSSGSPNGTVNGQPITQNTWFVVRRADIKLHADASSTDAHYGGTPDHSQMRTQGYWGTGFRNFRGHFVCSSNSPINHGIINESHAPLFESISATGAVDSVTVRGTTAANMPYSVTDFSPLCNVNNGKMSNCVNQVAVSSPNANLAGVCVTNNGTLYGCRNEGNLTAVTTKDVAGICLYNKSLIRRAQVLATAKLSGNHAGGLVLTNEGAIRESYANLNNPAGVGHFGGLAFENKASGTIQNSYVAGSYKAATGYTVGGICNINAGSILDCSNRMLSIQGCTLVGGLVATMTGGSICNSYFDGNGGGDVSNLPGTGIASTVGGLVGLLQAGTIENSYCSANCHLNTSYPSENVGSAVGEINSGSNAVKIWNVYGSSNVRFVSKSSGTAITISDCYGRSAMTGVNAISLNNFVLEYNGAHLQVALQNNVNGAGAGSKYRNWRDGNHPVFDI